MPRIVKHTINIFNLNVYSKFMLLITCTILNYTFLLTIFIAEWIVDIVYMKFA